MRILDKFRDYFVKKQTKFNPEAKTEEDIGAVMAPVFREIPPDSKAGEYLSQGLRSWAYIAISAIADEVSTVGITLFKRKGNEWEAVASNQILDLILKPNDIQTKETLFWLITLFLLAEGEAPLLLDKPKNPTQMVLLNPANLKLIYQKSEGIKEYEYRQSNGKTRTIPADEIVFLKLPNYMTPFRGMGVMKYISQTLDIDNFIEEYLRLFFYNDATPDQSWKQINNLARMS